MIYTQVDQYEILPPQVIEQIIDTPVKPHEIRFAFNLEAVFWRKVVNVKFCRLSEGFICGTVELCKRLKGHIDRKKTVSIGPRAFEMTFRKFHYLFLRQPALIHSFILDFLKIKIPGLKIMTGKEQELNLTEPAVNLPGIDEMMKENPEPMLEENTGREPVNLLDLIDTPKVRLLGQILQLQVRKSAGYEYKKQVADYETRLEQIRWDLIAKALEQLGRSGQDPGSYPPLYWFEVSPFWKGIWRMTRMRPMPDFVPYIYILIYYRMKWLS